MNILLLISYVFSRDSSSTLIFSKKNAKDVAELHFDEPVNVRDYSIMTGPLKATADQFTSIFRDDKYTGVHNKIEVPLSHIKNPTSNKLYGIRVTVVGTTTPMYSEPFRYSEKKKEWFLERVYEDDSWFVSNIYYILGGSLVLGCFIIGYLVARKRRQNTLETL